MVLSATTEAHIQSLGSPTPAAEPTHPPLRFERFKSCDSVLVHSVREALFQRLEFLHGNGIHEILTEELEDAALHLSSSFMANVLCELLERPEKWLVEAAVQASAHHLRCDAVVESLIQTPFEWGQTVDDELEKIATCQGAINGPELDYISDEEKAFFRLHPDVMAALPRIMLAITAIVGNPGLYMEIEHEVLSLYVGDAADGASLRSRFKSFQAWYLNEPSFDSLHGHFQIHGLC